MKKTKFQSLLKKKILIIDGATGTELQKYNVPKDVCPDYLNITHPDIVYKINKSYVDAGADIIETNTFGANRAKLTHYNLQNKVKDINKAGVEIAKKACKNKKVLVAGSVGPTGQLLYPEGTLSIDEAYNIFYEQIKFLIHSGADLIIIETQSDIEEFKIAVRAAQMFDIGLIAQMTFTEGERTLTGSTPEILCTIAEGLDIDVVGINCSSGPEGLLPIIKKMLQFTSLPVSIQPNAGLPVIKNNKTVFPASPANMDEYAQKFYKLGANIIGGCCGTTPEHIHKIAKKLKNNKPLLHSYKKCRKIASRNTLKLYGEDEKVLIIGERINPTGKKKLTEALKTKNLNYIIQLAKKQTNENADTLDINIGTPEVDEAHLMKKILNVVQNASQLPIVIDSSFTEVIKNNYKYIFGKGIINSINGKKKILEELLPVVKESGFSVIILAMDDKGIPDKAVDRVKITEKIIQKALDFGIKKENLIIDPLVMTISSNPQSALETIKAMQIIKNNLHIPISLGVSNISFGLPNRDIVNSSFFASAIMSGLDMVIMNPASELMQQSKLAADLLSARDPGAKQFLQNSIDITIGQPSLKAKTTQQHKKKESNDPLYQAVIEGNKETIISLTRQKENKFSAFDIINKFLIPAISEVGNLYDKGVYFLPQLIQSAQAMEKAVDYVKQKYPKTKESKGRLLICTVEGDIHSIGKNIVKMLLENHGYDIEDIGVDVKYKTIKSMIKKGSPNALLLSALMTTTMLNMKDIIKKLKKDKIHLPVIIGGAVVTENYAKKIGAIYGGDAVHSVKVINELLT